MPEKAALVADMMQQRIDRAKALKEARQKVESADEQRRQDIFRRTNSKLEKSSPIRQKKMAEKTAHLVRREAFVKDIQERRVAATLNAEIAQKRRLEELKQEEL
jgi:hypothetical protein